MRHVAYAISKYWTKRTKPKWIYYQFVGEWKEHCQPIPNVIRKKMPIVNTVIGCWTFELLKKIMKYEFVRNSVKKQFSRTYFFQWLTEYLQTFFIHFQGFSACSWIWNWHCHGNIVTFIFCRDIYAGCLCLSIAKLFVALNTHLFLTFIPIFVAWNAK